jgi:hypothetical protein
MVNDIITTVIDVITGLLAGIGSGIVDYFEAVFLNDAGTGLNAVGTFVFVLLGISAAFGLSALVFNMVRSRS